MRAMSTIKPIANKSADEETYKHMIPCGSYEMRKGNAETHGGDGINGTIVVPQSKLKAAGAGANERVRVRVETNGRSRTMEREIHSSGNTLTIPYNERQELDLEAGDEIQFWIEAIDSEEISKENQVQETLTEEEKIKQRDDQEDYVVIGDSFTYHLLGSQDGDETVCGIRFDEDKARTGKEPGDFLDACAECRIQSSKPLSGKQVIDLLTRKVSDFHESGGEITDLSPEQLRAVAHAIVERQEIESELREYRARVARLEQRIQELEDGTGQETSAQ
jgi:bifunctional DNA-binding transcriptional regulator/antitoxin component of YhaV-PrlF toxin-antitoxin module